MYSCHSFFLSLDQHDLKLPVMQVPATCRQWKETVHPATHAMWVAGRQLQSCPQKPGHCRLCTTWDAGALSWWLLQRWHWAQGPRLPGEPPDSAPGTILTWTEVCADVIRWKIYVGFPSGPQLRSQVSFKGSQRAKWQTEGERQEPGTRWLKWQPQLRTASSHRECRPTDALIRAWWYWCLTCGFQNCVKTICCLKLPRVCSLNTEATKT